MLCKVYITNQGLLKCMALVLRVSLWVIDCNAEKILYLICLLPQIDIVIDTHIHFFTGKAE